MKYLLYHPYKHTNIHTKCKAIHSQIITMFQNLTNLVDIHSFIIHLETFELYNLEFVGINFLSKLN